MQDAPESRNVFQNSNFFNVFCLHLNWLVIISIHFMSSGENLDGVDTEVAVQKLRGRVGTTVTVKVQSVIINSLFFFFQVSAEISDCDPVECGQQLQMASAN